MAGGKTAAAAAARSAGKVKKKKKSKKEGGKGKKGRRQTEDSPMSMAIACVRRALWGLARAADSATTKSNPPTAL
jgi:hypothetical protein